MKKLNEMTNEELKVVYEKGKQWMNDNDRTAKGLAYKANKWRAGLRRIEEIENELQRRNIKYG